MKRPKIFFILKLVYATSLMSVQIFIGSSIFIYSSIILTQLKDSSSDIKLNDEQASWIASIPNLMCPIGLIVSGMLTSILGRKKVLQYSYIPMIIGWLLLYFAKDFYYILIARIVLGLAYGSGIVTFIYTAEVCPTAQRPLFLALISVFTGFSMFNISFLGMYYDWKIIAAIYGVLSVCGALGLFTIPEPPKWLRSRNRNDEAIQAEKWFGVDSIPVNDDSEEIDTQPVKSVKLLAWSTYTAPNVWKPTSHVILFLIIQQWSGIYVLLAYSVDVLRNCGVHKDGITVTMYLSFARITGSITFFLLSGVKRRTLTIISGVMPIPWSIIGELFPMHVKGIMNAAATSIGYVFIFCVTKLYPMFVSKLGIKIVWTFYSCACLMIVLYGWFLMPETKGKSLEEISTSFESKKKNSVIE
ncbi:facilitated trehalose transporter Tret1-like isoform X3 [Daktulosphaira vitifoliae]|uniref:facilitated trehalose transporter Tret1-like isoform X3 n=1 Tax=Daktulosphaira vitifoliae TaxID=58002 RepID=UPI0021AB02DF|nr:facilitated trehalose transporter Tret1-like isoform X3 [Daktulosphaira vitifoliae]